jgi:hypothetical protein
LLQWFSPTSFLLNGCQDYFPAVKREERGTDY